VAAWAYAAKMADQPTPEQQVRQLYEQAESRLAKASERLVSRDSFGELLAMVTENLVALTRIGNEAMDAMLRNLRLAGRQDVARLARQIGRTEDKLEQVLQEIERMRDEVGAGDRRDGSAGGATPTGRGERRQEKPAADGETTAPRRGTQSSA
jgi:hypothetical protein